MTMGIIHRNTATPVITQWIPLWIRISMTMVKVKVGNKVTIRNMVVFHPIIKQIMRRKLTIPLFQTSCS